MRLHTHPVAQFAAAVLLAFVLVASVTSWLSSRAAEREAIVDARSVTEALGKTVVQPSLTRGLVTGDPGAIDRFDQIIRNRLRLEDVRRLKLWSSDGTIVYSDEPRLIGLRFPLGAEEREVLARGGSDAELTDLTQPENRFETGAGEIVEVYTRLTSPEGVPVLFETYVTLADVNGRTAEISRFFRPVTLGGTAVLTVLAAPLTWWLTRRLRRDAEAREALLLAAAEASDAERRRIARDLHDTVVQDLAGAAFTLAGVSRTGVASIEVLDRVGHSVRTSLRALRSLLVEIYPPDLHETGLRGALDDLLAPVEQAGIRTELVVEDLPELAPTAAAVVWRVAQEAVRNSTRHGDPDHLRVSLCGTGTGVTLVVEDDGTGFDPVGLAGRDQFGLRGMRDLIREAGGSLEVRSAPGEGTRVRLEVAT